MRTKAIRFTHPYIQAHIYIPTIVPTNVHKQRTLIYIHKYIHSKNAHKCLFCVIFLKKAMGGCGPFYLTLSSQISTCSAAFKTCYSSIAPLLCHLAATATRSSL